MNFNTDTGRVLFDDSGLLGHDDASLGEQFMIFKRIVLPLVMWVKLIHLTMQLYVPEDESVITATVQPSGLARLFFFATACGAALKFSQPCIQ